MCLCLANVFNFPGNTSLKDESSVAVAQKVLSAISLSVRDPEQRLSPTASLKPKMLGTVEAAVGFIIS